MTVLEASPTVRYIVMPQYDYATGERKKDGYAVVAETPYGLNKVYRHKFWIMCFLRANRLTRELGIIGYRAPLPSPKVPE